MTARQNLRSVSIFFICIGILFFIALIIEILKRQVSIFIILLCFAIPILFIVVGVFLEPVFRLIMRWQWEKTALAQEIRSSKNNLLESVVNLIEKDFESKKQKCWWKFTTGHCLDSNDYLDILNAIIRSCSGEPYYIWSAPTSKWEYWIYFIIEQLAKEDSKGKLEVTISEGQVVLKGFNTSRFEKIIPVLLQPKLDKWNFEKLNVFEAIHACDIDLSKNEDVMEYIMSAKQSKSRRIAKKATELLDKLQQKVKTLATQ